MEVVGRQLSVVNWQLPTENWSLAFQQPQQLGLGFRPRRQGFGSEAQQINRSSGFFESLRAMRAALSKVRAQLQRLLIRKHPEQEQFVNVL